MLNFSDCTHKPQSAHGVLGKGSVASVTRMGRPRALSHHATLLSAHSSSPLSEPSLKELHTRRAPLGLNHPMPAGRRHTGTMLGTCEGLMPKYEQQAKYIDSQFRDSETPRPEPFRHLVAVGQDASRLSCAQL